MLCFKQWQHGPERKEKKELTEIRKVPRKKARTIVRAAREGFAAPAKCVCSCINHIVGTYIHMGTKTRVPKGKVLHF